MGNLERDIGKLIAEVKALRDELHDAKKDIRTLLEWRWKLYGITAGIAIVSSKLVTVVEAVMRH